MAQGAADEGFDGLLSERGLVVEIAYEFAAEEPEVSGVLADGRRREVLTEEVFKEGAEEGDDLLAGEEVFGEAHPALRPVGKVGDQGVEIGLRVAWGVV